MRFNPFEYKEKTSGLPPGSFRENTTKDTTRLEAVHFNAELVKHATYNTSFTELFDDKDQVVFVLSQDGLGLDFLTQLNEKIEVQSLHLENLTAGLGKPTLVDFSSYQYAEVPFYYLEGERLMQSPVRLMFWENKVLVCTNDKTLSFDNIIQRINGKKGVVRTSKADYLFFILVDFLIDNVTSLMNDYNIRINQIEEQKYLSKDDFGNILDIRRQLLRIATDFFTFQTEINKYISLHPSMISKKGLVYFEDLAHHVDAFVIKSEILVNRSESLKDLYVTNISLKSNEIMQILTVLSTVFLPITFLTGLYGMNFEYIPELKYKYSYFILLSICAGLTMILLLYFKRKKWF